MLLFILNSALLGCALSLDSFSICVADALLETNMARHKKAAIILLHALLQAAMPTAGYLCVKFVASLLPAFLRITPYISLVLLSYIGSKMIYESLHKKSIKDDPAEAATTNSSPTLNVPVILLQGVAASIDALSVGFTIASYSAARVFLCVTIIAVTTGVFCVAAFFIGGYLSNKFSTRANILGGIILIAIGLEILIASFC